MMWLNPWASAGLLLLAVPLLVHLLARRSARVQRFPTLRFLGDTRLVAMRRSQLTDLPLLCLRLVIIAAAVAALAQPYRATPDRTARQARMLARVIVVDTSASMQRPTPAGAAAVAVARSAAAAAIADAAPALVVESAALPSAIAGAAAWLEGRSGIRELLIISDFQLGALDSLDLQSLTAGTGVRLQRVDVPATWQHEWRTRRGAFETTARAVAGTDSTTVEWLHRRISDDSDAGILLLAGEAEYAHAAAARTAALLNAPRPAAEPSVALLFPRHAGYDEVLAGARSPDVRWMVDVAARVRRDPALAAAAAGAVLQQPAAAAVVQQPVTAQIASEDTAASGRLLSLAYTQGGRPLAVAGAAVMDGREVLLIATRAEPGSVAAAALMAAVARALDPSPPVNELEPEVLADDVLARWERAAQPAAAPDAAGVAASDGRWLWLLCLALLAVEGWMRRPRGTGRQQGREPVAPEAESP